MVTEELFMASANVTTFEAARLNFRLPAEIKRRIEKAAIASGTTVTDFAVTALATYADEILDRQNQRCLTDRDRDIFLEMIENPTKPNEALRKAAKSYKKRFK